MNLKTTAFWVMIVMIVGLSLYVIYWTKTEPYKCVSNPYVYSIELMEKANNAPVTCLCSVEKESGSTVILDKNGFRAFQSIPQASAKEENMSWLKDLR